MPDIGKAYVQIVPSAKGIGNKVSDVLNNETKGAGESAGSSIGKNLIGTLGKLVMAAGIGKLVTDALNEGGNLQQSYIGGLETLYGEAADAARNYAKEAAAAGISMNDYSEQAVSFGAALKSAFSGDVTKAAEAANTAIMDMADNSAKMGTDIEAVQTAYQGFAKQNYTMLDNLKLGYGGTKTEMERLLKDATKLSGVEYNIDNLGDVYEAIHVIQGELGLTGVAAQEASETFSGSLGAMGAAFKNVIGQIAIGEDISASLTTLIQSASNFLFNNLLPMLGNIASALPGAISTALQTGVPIMLEKGGELLTWLIDGIQNKLPVLLQEGATMLSQIGAGIASGLPQITAKALDIIGQLSGGIGANLSTILASGVELLKNLIQGIVNTIPVLLAKAPKIIVDFAAGLLSQLPSILSSGIQILGTLVAGLQSAVPQVFTFLLNLVAEMANKIASTNWVQVGIDIINGIVSGLRSMAGAVGDYLLSIARNALDAVKNFFGISSPSKVMAQEVGKWLPIGIAKGIAANTTPLTNEMEHLADITTASIKDNIEYTASANNSNIANALGGGEQNEMVARLDAMLRLMQQYYPEMAEGTTIDGQALLSGIDRGLGLAVL